METRRWRALVAAVLTTVVVYWAVGAGVGTYLLKGQLQNLLAGANGQTLALDSLRFNPFTLTAWFDDLRVDDVDTGAVLTIPAGRLRLDFAGLFDDDFAARDVYLERPRLSAALSGPAGNRRFHSLGSLLSSADGNREPAPFRIARASVEGGRMTVHAAAGSEAPFSADISEIDLEIAGLSSDAATPAMFDLAGQINDSARLRAQGRWVPAANTVEAAVALNGLVLAPYASLFDGWLVDGRLAGVLAAHGQFRYLADTPGFAGDLVVEQLAVDDSSGQSVLSANKLAARGVEFGTQGQQAMVQRVELDGPGVALHLGVDGQADWQGVIARDLPRIDNATVRDGHLGFTDTRWPSAVQIDAEKITGQMTRRNDGSQETLEISLTGAFPEQGTAQISGVLHDKDGQIRAGGEASLSGVDASLVSAYFSDLTSRKIEAGRLDLNLRFEVDDTEVSMSSNVSVVDLELGPSAGDVPVWGSPLDLTVALLTDEKHQLTFELPVSVAKVGSGDAFRTGFDDAMRRLVNATTADPLNRIARLAGLEVDELSHIAFATGSPEVLPAAERRLAAWVEAMAQRPLIGLRAQGSYAARTDREALARRQVKQHIGLAASTRNGDPSIEAELDFGDPKVQAVLDEFALSRLDETERDALEALAFDNGSETAAVAEFYPAVFESLAAKESVSDYALRQLARYRAYSVVGRLQELGIAAQRLKVDKRVASVESDDKPATVALTIIAYEESTD